MQMPKSLRGMAKSPWAWGAAALGAWWILRPTKKSEPDLDLVVFGVDMKRPGVSDGVGYDDSTLDIPAKPTSSSKPASGGYKMIQDWRLLSTWDDDEEVERWITDVQPGDKVRVDIVASVPLVGDWIKIGNKKYTYDDGPSGAAPAIKKILRIVSKAAESGIAGAEATGQAPKGSSSIVAIILDFLKAIPDAYEKWRLKKYLEWREGLAATKNLRSDDMFTAHKDSDVCQWWRYEGVATGDNKDLTLVPTPQPPPYYIETLGTCLQGPPPRVEFDGLHVIVTIHSPDVPRESRYDVIVSKGVIP